MEHVKKEDRVRHEHSPDCIVYEYPMQNKEINIALAEITHRYPDRGYAINYKCTEMGYVLKGSGKLTSETQTVELFPGDAFLISAGEKYYFEGTLSLLLPATPAWVPEQHEATM